MLNHVFEKKNQEETKNSILKNSDEQIFEVNFTPDQKNSLKTVVC